MKQVFEVVRRFDKKEGMTVSVLDLREPGLVNKIRAAAMVSKPVWSIMNGTSLTRQEISDELGGRVVVGHFKPYIGKTGYTDPNYCRVLKLKVGKREWEISSANAGEALQIFSEAYLLAAQEYMASLKAE